jgi:hypothetical protein
LTPPLIVAGAIAVGATVTATAPIAHAEKLSESIIKSECKSAGGTYATAVRGSPRVLTETMRATT